MIGVGLIGVAFLVYMKVACSYGNLKKLDFMGILFLVIILIY
jgi:hypothetical protein